ncbi:hypothetical protein BpHYR1_046951 [Brachionus plicatilis]|uniref:Uncharacterized protein n=1 Tax=Brachionus plicatilis TaxID=10195 RepID=A0A3M7PK18_BRAPC|nr:hypothetical protein BpHYR1_046951 [Brachionus plicatilis]
MQNLTIEVFCSSQKLVEDIEHNFGLNSSHVPDSNPNYVLKKPYDSCFKSNYFASSRLRQARWLDLRVFPAHAATTMAHYFCSKRHHVLKNR